MARITRKELKQDEVRDAAADFGHWLEENWPTVLKGVGAAVVAALAVYGWIWMGQQNRHKAGNALAEGEQLFAQAAADPFVSSEDLPAALEQFESAADRAGSSPTGLVAQYYRGASLYRLAEYEKAIACLEEVVAGADKLPTLAASAQVLLSSAYADGGQLDKAVTLLNDAAEREGGPLPADAALSQLARLHEGQGDGESAAAAWQRILDDYPQAPAAGAANRALAR